MFRSQSGQTMQMSRTFDCSAYRTTTDCLNAASVAGVPLRAALGGPQETL